MNKEFLSSFPSILFTFWYLKSVIRHLLSTSQWLTHGWKVAITNWKLCQWNFYIKFQISNCYAGKKHPEHHHHHHHHNNNNNNNRPNLLLWKHTMSRTKLWHQGQSQNLKSSHVLIITLKFSCCLCWSYYNHIIGKSKISACILEIIVERTEMGIWQSLWDKQL